MEFLTNTDYSLVLLGAFVLFWLVWLPRILAPLILPRYDKIPEKYKAIILMVLPTIEGVMLNSWNRVHKDYLLPAVLETDYTDLDDKLLQIIDDRVQLLLREKEELE